MRLEDVRPRCDQSHAEDCVAEAVKVGQVAPVLILPHVDVTVNCQPGS